MYVIVTVVFLVIYSSDIYTYISTLSPQPTPLYSYTANHTYI